MHALDLITDGLGVISGPGEDGVDRLHLLGVLTVDVAVEMSGQDHLGENLAAEYDIAAVTVVLGLAL